MYVESPIRSKELLDHLSKRIDIPDGVQEMTIKLRLNEPAVINVEYLPLVSRDVPPKPKPPVKDVG